MTDLSGDVVATRCKLRNRTLTAVVHTHSHLILGAVPGVGPSQDSPDFTPAMRQASALIRIDTALRDAG
jgi:hypothetical protein